MSWIRQANSWGGAIELAIFSEYYQTGTTFHYDFVLIVEIVSVDVSTCRMDRFGEGKYKQVVFVLYSGIHYDALALSPSLGASQEFDQTSFDITDPCLPEYFEAAVKLAGEWKKQHKFTDLSNFTLKCAICSKVCLSFQG